MNDLVERITPDMPMMRILGGEHSMTFTDPNDYRLWAPLRTMVPDYLAIPFRNAWTFLGESDDISTDYVNAVAGFVFGLVGGVALMDKGTALVPDWSSYGNSTKAFNAADADIKKMRYEGAAHAREYNPLTDPMTYESIGASFAAAHANMLALLLVPVPIINEALVVASAVANAPALAAGMLPTLLEALDDLYDSHEIAKTRILLDTLYSAEFSYSKILGGDESGDIRLIEDFLYERPFVNLALFVSDSALRAVEPECYYEAENSKKQQLCEVGLLGADGKVVASNGKENYSEFRKGELKFRSESDWSKMGVKVDRWEKVDGLTPEGKDTSDYVPIRHVERYEVPAITVEDWIEKYSFVVDDLMPHRLRQIRMNFNYQEEIASHYS